MEDVGATEGIPGSIRNRLPDDRLHQRAYVRVGVWGQEIGLPLLAAGSHLAWRRVLYTDAGLVT